MQEQDVRVVLKWVICTHFVEILLNSLAYVHEVIVDYYQVIYLAPKAFSFLILPSLFSIEKELNMAPLDRLKLSITVHNLH